MELLNSIIKSSEDILRKSSTQNGPWFKEEFEELWQLIKNNKSDIVEVKEVGSVEDGYISMESKTFTVLLETHTKDTPARIVKIKDTLRGVDIELKKY